jgi:hypothetical protein
MDVSSALGDRVWNSFGAGRECGVPAAHHAGVANRGQAELEGGAMWIGDATRVVPVEEVFAEFGVPARCCW